MKVVLSIKRDGEEGIYCLSEATLAEGLIQGTAGTVGLLEDDLLATLETQVIGVVVAGTSSQGLESFIGGVHDDGYYEKNIPRSTEIVLVAVIHKTTRSPELVVLDPRLVFCRRGQVIKDLIGFTTSGAP